MRLGDRQVLVAVWCAFNVWVAGVSFAQNSPSMVIAPWEDGRYWAETVDDLLFFDGGHTKGSNLDTGMFYWDSYGRVRFDRDDSDPHWIIGYHILTMTEDSESAPINGDYWDIALTLAHKFDEWDNGWRLSVIGGAGTANDNHFSDTDAIYGIGIINVGRKLDEDSSVNLGLLYNGNRLIFPDFPLPYVAYQRKVSEQFSFTLGVPSVGLHWRPVQPVSIQVDYTAPVKSTANLSVWLTETFSVFTEFDSTCDGFYIENADARRIFYSNLRGVAGVRWISKWADARLGVGYAFRQEFTRGFDLRNTDVVEKLTDEPFLSLLVRGTF